MPENDPAKSIGTIVNRRMNWFRFSFWAIGFLLVASGALWGASCVLLRRTPDWYQPDTRTEAQRNKAAEAIENILLTMSHLHGKARATPVRARLPADPAGADAATQQARTILAQRPNEAFQISFTDDQLNAFFDKWANTHERRAWFERYVTDPRLVLRENQLILVGKVKEPELVVSLIFEPRLNAQGQLELNLVHVLGGVLPMPDALWTNQRAAIEDALRAKLPIYQQGASITPEGIANADTGSAAMNELLLALLNYKPTSAVILVPTNMSLSQSLPVKITELAIHDHTLQMTAQQMNEEEREAFLRALKARGDDSSGQPQPQ